MAKAYLTIDDSPSPQTDALVDYLLAKNIPALLFCRGDLTDANPEPVIRALQKGFPIGNHAYSHSLCRASQRTYEEVTAEILKTETLIEHLYKKAGVQRAGKYMRFPHMDRGCGGWVVDYEAWPQYKNDLLAVFATGLNAKLTPPTPADVEKKQRLQDFLRAEGFTSPYRGITFPWYADTECATAVDAMFTYSTADWMITPRHLGKWPYKSLDDLKKKIDDDPFLKKDSAHIILAHDQDGLLDTVTALIDHFTARGFTFEKV